MAHISYKTLALVLGTLPRGEANKVYILLTPDQGLIYAHAQGIRYEKSKLRFSLSDYAYCEVMLVHGKSGWRITTATLIKDIYTELPKENFMVIARVFSLLQKLVTGEEGNQTLFTHAVEAIETLENKNISVDEVSRIEIGWVLRTLFVLGYINPGNLKEVIELPLGDLSQKSEFDELRNDALARINHAIYSSQLFF